MSTEKMLIDIKNSMFARMNGIILRTLNVIENNRCRLSSFEFAFNATVSNEQLQELGIDAIIKNTIALTRAVAYKRSLDIKNKSALENGAEQFQTVIFETMSRDNPKLYRELKKFIKNKSKELNCKPSE